MPNIHKDLTIAAPIDRVWAALTDPAIIAKWMTDDSVQIDLRPEGEYVLFGGETTGRFTHITAPHFLEYTWRQRGWPDKWEESVVRWELHAAGTSTNLHLMHTHFPNKDERDSHEEGWNMYWLQPMQQWLETGQLFD